MTDDCLAETNDATSAQVETLDDVSVDVTSPGDDILCVVDVESGETVESSLQDAAASADIPRTANEAQRPSLTRGMPRRESSRWLGGMGVSSAHLVRKSSAIDMETGQQGGKEMLVEEVTSYQEAMNPSQRLFNQLFGITEETSSMEEEEEETTTTTTTPTRQYRLTTRPCQHRRSLVEILTGTSNDCDDYDVTVGAKADLLTKYLRWTFRTSFSSLFLFKAACFLALSCIFAVAIHLMGILRPACINVGGLDYDQAGNYFMDAFTLSWVTLSTVGYGNITPNLAIPGGPRCLLVNMFCTVESFVGLLFASFCGAIIFGKVVRTQSFAPTSFSDPIVVRYGTALMKEVAHDGASSTKSVDTTASPQKYPCPVLEFRVANRMHWAGGGEIMNCHLNVISSVFESTASGSLRDSVLHKSFKKKSGMATKAGDVFAETAKQVGKVATGTAKMAGNVASGTAKQVGKVTGTTNIVSGTAKQVGNVGGKVLSGVGSVAGTVTTGVTSQAKQMTTVLKSALAGTEKDRAFDPDEGIRQCHNLRRFKAASLAPQINALVDEGSNLVPRRIFSNLEVQTPVHPFFKRVWYVRHVLDENSPLLSAKAKEMIIGNDGFWPEELNSHEAVRNELHFHEIIVNLSGTANATGSVVYCQKVYSFVDVNIGYAFVNMLRRQDDGRISVDLELLNDVVEQHGGGGEPFTDVMDTDLFGAAVGAAAGNVADNIRNVADHAQEPIDDTVQQVVATAKTAAGAAKDNISFEHRKETVVKFKDTVDIVHDGEQTGEKKHL